MSQEKTYCVECGEAFEILFWLPVLPYDTASASKGESGCVCQLCDSKLSNPPPIKNK